MLAASAVGALIDLLIIVVVVVLIVWVVRAFLGAGPWR